MKAIEINDGGTPPFLRWAGGKRWLTNRAFGLPKNSAGTYFEPFLGSGAMFFHLRPNISVLSDSNAALVETYQAIKSNHQRVARHLHGHAKSHSSDYYYRVRATKYRNEFSRAAQFIYLNRTCWNGLYRVNKQGEFNVPIGTKTSVLREDDNFSDIAAILANSEICNVDFEKQIDRAVGGDFIFADPPYTVRHKHNGFIEYNETLFSWQDQVRLMEALDRAKKRGVQVMLTNADHQSIRTLYRKGFEIEEVSRFSAISGTTKGRGNFPELLIF